MQAQHTALGRDLRDVGGERAQRAPLDGRDVGAARKRLRERQGRAIREHQREAWKRKPEALAADVEPRAPEHERERLVDPERLPAVQLIAQHVEGVHGQEVELPDRRALVPAGGQHRLAHRVQVAVDGRPLEQRLWIEDVGFLPAAASHRARGGLPGRPTDR
jgi:sRNA-binding protein